MAIGITYGPISAGLGLAQQSGQAAARRFNTQEDMDFLNMMQQAQAHADQKYANQVQQALGVQEFNANQGLQEQQLAAQNQRSQAELAMMGNRLNFQQANADRNAGLRQQAISNTADYRDQRLQNQEQTGDLAAQKFQTQQDAINNLPSDVQDVVRATGRMPYTAGGNPANQMALRLQAESKILDAEIAREQRNQKSFMVDPKDLVGARSEQGSLPGVAKGFEPQWQASQAKIITAQQRQAQIQASLQQLNSGPQGAPAVNSAAVIKGLQSQQATHGGAAEQSGDKGQGDGGGNTPVVHNAQEYAQLPPGAHYINARNGQEYVKPS